MSKPYSSYTQFMLRKFFTEMNRNGYKHVDEVPPVRDEDWYSVRGMNDTACRNALLSYSDSDVELLRIVYTTRGTVFADTVQKIGTDLGVSTDYIWKTIKNAELSVASHRGLI